MPANISLITASLDLQLVRLLRDAMGTTAARAGLYGSKVGPTPEIEPRLRHEPEPVIEPRRVHHPDPHFAPRPVVHPEPVYQNPPTIGPVEPEKPCRVKTPFPPVWKTLPPVENPAQTAPKVKVVIQRPDIVHKGSLIDFFI
jgi:hypothetical protein